MSTASRIVRAISLGVFWRLAPSTRPIIRSRNVWPRSAVIRTTMRSESTFVPPVTAERSPPDSRITGADSPVMADSSTEAMPSIISPSEGMMSPASHTTESPLLRDGCRDPFLRAVRQEPAGQRLRAHLTERLGLCLTTAFGHRLGEVGKEHSKEQPDRDAPVEEARVGDRLYEGDDSAHEHDEHDRVLDLDARVQFLERIEEGLAQDLAVEEAP